MRNQSRKFNVLILFCISLKALSSMKFVSSQELLSFTVCFRISPSLFAQVSELKASKIHFNHTICSYLLKLR
jgi:hypothetical protein